METFKKVKITAPYLTILIAAPSGFWRPFGKCPKTIGVLFGNALKVADTI
jgi:hypothetical protein